MLCTIEPVYKPDAIVYYNKNMGGVDLLSRVLISYSSQSQNVKWRGTTVELFLDICVNNYSIVWLKLKPEKEIDHLTYRRNIVTETIPFHFHREKTYQIGPKTIVNNPLRLGEKHFTQP